MYITPDMVKQFTGVNKKDFRDLENDETKLDELITVWISQASNIIDAYCHTTFNSEFKYYPTIQNVCLRLCANMIALAQARKDSPIIKYNDWNIQSWISSNIFSDDLKSDLEPFKVEQSRISDNVDIITITGEDINKTKW